MTAVPIYCPRCGTKFEAEGRFCAKCGAARGVGAGTNLKSMREEAKDAVARAKKRYEQSKRLYERAKKLKHGFDKRVGA